MERVSLDLGYLYEDQWLDLEQGNSLIRLMFWNLEYWRNGKTIKIPAFKTSELGTLDDLRYYDKYFQKHADKVYDFCEFLNEQLRAITNYDINSQKELAQDEWDSLDDEEKEEYDDDFDNFWETYSSTSSFHEIVGEEQREQLDSLIDEFKDEFGLIDKEFRDGYYDSYDNLIINVAEKFEEAIDDVKEAVKEFRESAIHIYSMESEEKAEIFEQIFK